MWDNRIGKKNPKAPDFKCKKNSCGGVIWPPRPGNANSREIEGALRDAEEIFEAEQADQDATLPF